MYTYVSMSVHLTVSMIGDWYTVTHLCTCKHTRNCVYAYPADQLISRACVVRHLYHGCMNTYPCCIDVWINQFELLHCLHTLYVFGWAGHTHITWCFYLYRHSWKCPWRRTTISSYTRYAGQPVVSVCRESGTRLHRQLRQWAKTDHIIAFQITASNNS